MSLLLTMWPRSWPLRCFTSLKVFFSNVWVFKNFFQFSTIGDKFTLCACKNTHILVPNGKKSPKNWQIHWFWVNDSRFGGPYFHTEETCDSTAKLLPQDQKTVCVLNSFIVVPEDLPEYILVGAGMSTKCCRFQEMPEFCFVSGGKIYVSYFTPISFSSLIFLWKNMMAFVL